jgi:hypothetical protein
MDLANSTKMINLSILAIFKMEKLRVKVLIYLLMEPFTKESLLIIEQSANRVSMCLKN